MSKEYKIGFPKNGEHKSFKIINNKDDFIGTLYVDEDAVYISLKDYKIMPANLPKRVEEIEY